MILTLLSVSLEGFAVALFTSDNYGQEGSIVGGDMKKLLVDTDTLLLLISCQNLHHARYITPNKKT
jgi:hypothetical protein